MTGSQGLKLDERLGLSASDSIGPLVSENSRAPVYKLNVGEVTKEPIKAENDVYVVARLRAAKIPIWAKRFRKNVSRSSNECWRKSETLSFLTYLATTQKQLKTRARSRSTMT